jgi:hypothetical protein
MFKSKKGLNFKKSYLETVQVSKCSNPKNIQTSRSSKF